MSGAFSRFVTSPSARKVVQPLFQQGSTLLHSSPPEHFTPPSPVLTSSPRPTQGTTLTSGGGVPSQSSMRLFTKPSLLTPSITTPRTSPITTPRRPITTFAMHGRNDSPEDRAHAQSQIDYMKANKMIPENELVTAHSYGGTTDEHGASVEPQYDPNSHTLFSGRPTDLTKQHSLVPLHQESQEFLHSDEPKTINSVQANYLRTDTSGGSGSTELYADAFDSVQEQSSQHPASFGKDLKFGGLISALPSYQPNINSVASAIGSRVDPESMQTTQGKVGAYTAIGTAENTGKKVSISKTQHLSVPVSRVDEGED